jgi:hypothetical protein
LAIGQHVKEVRAPEGVVAEVVVVQHLGLTGLRAALTGILSLHRHK